MLHRLRLSLSSAVVALAATAALAPSGSAAVGKAYVAFGDSYAAGPGLAGYTGDPTTSCPRSTVNYPSKIAATIAPAGNPYGWVDYTCAGALMSYSNALHPAFGGLKDQVFNWANSVDQQALGTQTKLVTITAGGNDSWNGKRSPYDSLIRCGGSNAEGAQGTTCVTSAGAPIAGSNLPVPADITAASYYAAIAPTITEIRRTAPTARIEIVGYPGIVPKVGSGQFTCNGGWFWYFEDSEKNYIHSVLTALKNAQQGAVAMYPASANVRFVDLYTPSNLHDFCAAEANRWVQNPIFNQNVPNYFDQASLHPTAVGMQAFATYALSVYSGA